MGIQVREMAQATSGQMDKVEQQLEFVCSDYKEEAELVVGYEIFGLKAKILREVERKLQCWRQDCKPK